MLKCARIGLPIVWIVCAGCAGSIERQEVGPNGTGGATLIGTPDTGGNSGWDAGDAGGASTVALTTCTDGNDPPVAVASKQRVTFVLRNTGSELRFIATEGTYCTPFGIAEPNAGDWRALTLETRSNACSGRCELCTCDAPTPVPYRLVALAPGDTYSMNWDARSVTSCEVPIAECPDKTKRVGASQPIAPGQYLFKIPIASAVPNNCKAGDQAGNYTCSPTGLAGCNWSLPMCRLESSVSLEFSLPESGDLQLDVPLE